MRFAICLAAAACAAVWATSAFAQAMLPPHEIVASVRSMGLQPIGTPVRRGKRYIMRAVDGRGYQLRVAADAFTGRILGVRPIGYGHEFGYGTYRPGPPYPMEAIPPRGPYDRLAAPPGAYERPPARIRSEPSVIYAPGSNAASQPPSRPPSAAKPSAKPAAPKVAAKPAKAPAPAAAETSAAPAQPADTTTGATSPQAAENSPVAVPPVQSLE